MLDSIQNDFSEFMFGLFSFPCLHETQVEFFSRFLKKRPIIKNKTWIHTHTHTHTLNFTDFPGALTSGNYFPDFLSNEMSFLGRRQSHGRHLHSADV